MTWGLKWRSVNKLDGVTEHLIYRNYVPAIFSTRRDAREWAIERYGYIRYRQDLRNEPYGWRMPIAVKVSVAMIPK